MARLANAIYVPISPIPARMSVLDGVVVHTSVTASPAPSATASFMPDGTCYQHRDTLWRTEANLNGNWHLGAFECMDRGPAFGNWNINDGHAVPGFTPAQRESIADKLAQYNIIHSVPLAMLPNSISGYRGIGYHRMGCDGSYLANGYIYPGRVPGGEKWSSSVGKVCPGDRRITELINIILPRARVLAGHVPPPQPPIPPVEEEDILATKEEVISGFFSHPDFKELLTNSRTAINLQERVLLVLDSQNLDDSEKLRRIRNLILTTTQQVTWSQLSTVTWNEMRGSRWGRILIESN